MERVTFPSNGLKLSGVLHAPAGGDRRPAFLVLHGFGSNKDSGGSRAVARLLADFGYATLCFDFRGCGESEGPRGRVICLEQVEDTRNALSFMAGRPEVDPERVGAIGMSFGAAVAIYAAGVDSRVPRASRAGAGATGPRSSVSSTRRLMRGSVSPT